MNLTAQVEQALQQPVRHLSPRPGGDAAQAYTLELEDGRQAFVKTVSTGAPFPVEAEGLRLLNTESGVRVPDVLTFGDQFLVLELLQFGSPGPEFQEELGRRLALTHQTCRADGYGFTADHWIGATPQKNTPTVPYRPDAWAEFWWTHRLEPMFQRLNTPSLHAQASRLEARLSSLIGPVDERPSLIHGDLWSGNRAADANGAPVMFDPAPSYSHREAELGMCRMFGGFPAAFYRAYEEQFPLAEGWRERQNLYMLYHMLNHAVLFGSGYLQQADQILRSYV